MTSRVKKTHTPPLFRVAQFVDVMRRQPGADVFRRRVGVASVTNRMVKLRDGSTWRVTDGCEWGTEDGRGRYAPRIVPSTGFILCQKGVYVQIGEDGLKLGFLSAATSWETRAEAEGIVGKFGLKHEWTVFNLASFESTPVRAVSEPEPPARPLLMSDTEWALYWATEGWLEKDVAGETGLPEAERKRLWAEVERVRARFQSR